MATGFLLGGHFVPPPPPLPTGAPKKPALDRVKAVNVAIVCPELSPIAVALPGYLFVRVRSFLSHTQVDSHTSTHPQPIFYLKNTLIPLTCHTLLSFFLMHCVCCITFVVLRSTFVGKSFSNSHWKLIFFHYFNYPVLPGFPVSTILQTTAPHFPEMKIKILYYGFLEN